MPTSLHQSSFLAHHHGREKLSQGPDRSSGVRPLRPRLVEPGPQVITALRQLLPTPRGFAEAYYFEVTRDDTLLAAFAEGPLYEWSEHGRVTVDPQSVSAWLADLAKQGATPPWTETTRTKVARGLLSTLRDFGILTGAVRKEFAPASLSIAGFGYVSYRLHEAGASSRAVFASGIWRRWLLDADRVTALFHEAARHGLLHYASAGSAVRIDWLQDTLSEVVSAVA